MATALSRTRLWKPSAPTRQMVENVEVCHWCGQQRPCVAAKAGRGELWICGDCEAAVALADALREANA